MPEIQTKNAIIPSEILKAYPALDAWCILSGYRGSLAHGTHIPPEEELGTDDRDLIAVCVPPQSYYLGLEEFGSRGTQEIKTPDGWDIVIFELKKFIRLLMDGNPNVLALLWLPDELYLSTTDAGQKLMASKSLFATKQAYRSFIGYAKNQLHRMTHQAYQGYMGEKRKRLVNRFGFDTKNASHLIRILRMGVEFLATGELLVRRPDADDLVAIKQGKWSLEQITQEASRLFCQAEQAYQTSSLPNEPDRKAIGELCQDIIWERLLFGSGGLFVERNRRAI